MLYLPLQFLNMNLNLRIFKNLLFFLALSLFLANTTLAFAEFIPPGFSSCPVGSETIKADFPVGEHAIVGVTGLQSGSDKVFSIGDNNFVQCFCPAQGSGTQTNWLSAGNINQVDRNNLITQGWVLIPNGADWGLDPQPYLAKNMDFSCNGGSVQGSNSTSGGSGGNSSGSSGGSGGSSGGQGGGEVLGISTLAATQNPNTKYYVLLSLSLGLLLIAYGYKIQKK